MSQGESSYHCNLLVINASNYYMRFFNRSFFEEFGQDSRTVFGVSQCELYVNAPPLQTVDGQQPTLVILRNVH